MSEIDDIIIRMISDEQSKKKYVQNDSTLVGIIRRFRKGLPVAVLIILLTLLCAFVLHHVLRDSRRCTTRMEILIENGTKNGTNGSLLREIIGSSEAYNILEEIRIMRSRSVMDRVIRNSHLLDAAYRDREHAFNRNLTETDSIAVYEECIRKCTEAINISYNERLTGKTGIVDIYINGYEDNSCQLLLELIDSYDHFSLDYKYDCYDITLRLLRDAIDSIKVELCRLDDFDRIYSTDHSIINLGAQAQVYLDYDINNEQEVRDIQLQRSLLDIIRSYMAEMGDDYKIVPANTGIDDDQINKIVLDFNELVMRRSEYLTSMGEDAMRVQSINNQIEDMRQSIIISIDELSASFDIRLNNYLTNKMDSQKRLLGMPEQQLIKEQIHREREIFAPMYQMLQTKYTETLIAKASEQKPVRIVTQPYIEEWPVINNPLSFYLLALAVGVMLAFVYLLTLKLPVRKLDVEDVTSRSELPVLGILPDSKETEFFSPALKALMTRIEMENAKMILVTSGYGGEGKTTIVNHITEYLKCRGISVESYSWKSIESTGTHNEGDLKTIISHNKGNGKYIIIDGGSYHENPDLPLLSRETDITLYTIRTGHSLLSSLFFCNNMVQEGLLYHGAVAVCQAPADKGYAVSFGSFDYESHTGLEAVKNIERKCHLG